MKIVSKKPKGQRIFKSTHKHTSSYYSMEREGYKNIWSIKAAKRAIFNWNVPKGTVFRVGLPWVGYDFLITK